MKKVRITTFAVLAAVMLLSLCGCAGGLDDGQKRLEQIANGETTVPVVAPQTVAATKKNETVADTTSQAEAGSDAPNVTQEEITPIEITGDEVDLTKMSSTVVYAQVLDILSYPDKYLGKKITMGGLFSIYEDPDSGYIYYACVIQDATACCANGIEFICKDERKYPEDYPELGTDIRVSGIFETYTEGEYLYCRLKDADMQVAAQ